MSEMKNAVSKNERLSMILEKCCGGVKSRFAERLNVDVNIFLMRLSRGTWYDACALAEAFPELNAEWVLTGEGEMMKEEINANA